ncbi:MAG: hypothetical protein COY75_05805 [Nitrospirae bacterium CG_4_10_14_0_8_um_filter_41_23]|nr:MAG: hypothetical protein COV68_00340 [Nitrospirae bacterium CG11_big_fil_rev_8_21_14_0_20_41_14]PIV44262.1 MAG: hypothetical protein COS27_02370 [Nitrospirae bacterium CG02_land_8_20_14_3_00_41_53]PIW87620.1 MAG: hypothetical protein COZ94_04150 [Nitrospirae bacterium CG_4_8_14_3_um_filter_41_47]PIY86863.1 MAG: hypothetical protein COY75_05805 [Nitrospirae bacterium CG_4_10_14_0_8_um_filter_41_23]PJA81177.1 MAG: hypothetical protein CO148_00080 [Nitrospirae bacterium CG_4_9_14_3_um_filter_4
MKPISEKFVEKTWQEVAGFSTNRAIKEMQKMGKNQSDLLAFLMALTEDLDPEVRELAIYIAFVVYRIFEGSRIRIKKITSKEIIDCYEYNEDLIGKLEGADEKFIDRIARIQISKQPHVMKYVVEALMEGSEDGDDVVLTDEDKGFLFLLLKTVVDLLDKKTY